jgi:hypothetical protein
MKFLKSFLLVIGNVCIKTFAANPKTNYLIYKIYELVICLFIFIKSLT